MNEENNQLFPAEETPAAPRRRGRPRKNPVPAENVAAAPEVKTPAKRGRKSKAALEEAAKTENNSPAPEMPQVPAAAEPPAAPAAQNQEPAQEKTAEQSSANNTNNHDSLFKAKNAETAGAIAMFGEMNGAGGHFTAVA